MHSLLPFGRLGRGQIAYGYACCGKVRGLGHFTPIQINSLLGLDAQTLASGVTYRVIVGNNTNTV